MLVHLRGALIRATRFDIHVLRATLDPSACLLMLQSWFVQVSFLMSWLPLFIFFFFKCSGPPRFLPFPPPRPFPFFSSLGAVSEPLASGHRRPAPAPAARRVAARAPGRRARHAQDCAGARRGGRRPPDGLVEWRRRLACAGPGRAGPADAARHRTRIAGGDGPWRAR